MFDYNNIVSDTDIDEAIDQEKIIGRDGLSELAYIMGEDEDTMEQMVYDMGYEIY